MQLSVILCAHNPRLDYLARVIEALRMQSLPVDAWELVLVDNRSDVLLADCVDLRWHPGGRHIREEELGSTPAHLRGIREATGKLLVFVDDDNVLSPDYLENALEISAAHPFLGAWGGGINLQFEAAPADWTRPYWWLLAARTVAEPVWSNDPRNLEFLPLGAGLCIRALVARFYADEVSRDPRRRLFGRTGRGSLLGAEDTDLILTSRAKGLGWGNFPQLSLQHLIPPHRVAEDYLLRLREGAAQSHTMLLCMMGTAQAPPPRSRSLLSWFKIRVLRGRHAADFFSAEMRGMREGFKTWNLLQTQ